MSDVNNIKARITNVNKTIATLNSNNDGNIAKKQLLNSQFSTGCEGFKKKYGVEVDSTNVLQLRDDTVKEKEAELVLMEAVTSSIQNGDVATANELLGIKTEETVIMSPTEGQYFDPQNIVQPTEKTMPEGVVVQTNTEQSPTVNKEVAQNVGINVGQVNIPTKPLNTIPVNTNSGHAGSDAVTQVSHGSTIRIKAVPLTDDDEEEVITPVKVQKEAINMSDLANIGASGSNPNITNDVGVFMKDLGQENVGTSNSSGNALGKGLNDLIDGNI